MSRRILLGAALLLALSGCTTGSPSAAPSPTSTLPVPGAACPAYSAAGKVIRFGHGLGGVVVGTGTTGVVLAHEADADLCYWAAVAFELRDKGYRVLAFDFNGNGSSELTARPYEEDVAEAVQLLRGEGAATVALVGASMGGTSVLVAATRLTPKPVAVVSLSAPFAFGPVGQSVLNVADKLTMPVLYLCGTGDARFAEAAQQMSDATTASTDRKLALVADNAHGARLINPNTNALARKAFFEFLAAHAPA
ncbi:alpha/beta hydrolase family protein [Catellatospora tritici]|uniref:alpha/beta hydrolase family protein n=1 Tax=Catellatospora tritici TaxID=2851566 RepID=UPI001C2D2C5E|nr:alpha/beta fold hydrolase [Catellatospora tritici]MBV1854796.1 alpha/beta hydrolase [Catellatospora tritici]